ncbi:MAG: DUF547 domain-containing protein [Parasphingorhabdus sp.]|uniref:DUF547 domain-containing protein n=1 Tax=Parasphingorhabdus sp. TaxID=2709688 RepID=UPI003299E03A
MKKNLATIFCLLAATSAQAATFDHSGWNSLLNDNVEMAADGTSSTANYTQFLEDRAALKIYLDAMSSVTREEFDGWSNPDQLAFLINAYNAWTVELILTAYPNLTSIKELGTLTQSPWQKEFIPLLGETLSLDNIEHDIIRGSGRYDEPRIHFAVNCASIGCPSLLNEAFVGSKLEAQLERMTDGFLRDRSRNRLENGNLAVSTIFNWYGDDFEQGWRDAETLDEFFALYADSLGLSDTDIEALSDGDMEISFLEYDWRLNDSKGPGQAENSNFISPLWLIRSNPLLGAAAGGLLLVLIGGGFYLIRRRRKQAAQD